MKRFPAEFEDALSARGRRLLARPHPPGRRGAFTGLLRADLAAAAPRLLEAAVGDCLALMEEPIPPETITAATENYAERLPKTVRVRTALLSSRRSRAAQRLEAIGLLPMLRSSSFHAFAQALSGRALRRGWGTQVLCYRQGDYTGPHTDHHPEEPDARDGYVDVHLTFCNGAVAHQWLVSEQGGHLSDVTSLATRGGVTWYRLPLWHYTTPLVGRRGREDEARRWVLLGTFLDARRPGTRDRG